MEQKSFFYIGEEEDKFEEGTGSSDEDTMEEDCYECKVREWINVTVILLFAYQVTIVYFKYL